MESRYTINQITRSTRDWTCKVQVVDKIRPKISKDQRVKFQTIIVQDENVCFTACQSSAYAIPMNIFEWVVDTWTIIEEVTENNEEEEELLPLPTRLNLVSFADIDKQVPGTEFEKGLSCFPYGES